MRIEALSEKSPGGRVILSRVCQRLVRSGKQRRQPAAIASLKSPLLMASAKFALEGTRSSQIDDIAAVAADQ